MLSRSVLLWIVLPLLIHADPRASNMEVVANVPTGTITADVWVHNRHVYLGSRGCGEGVSIVDATDAGNARLIGRLPGDANSNYEDVVVLSADTGSFKGDLLATGVQPCNQNGDKRGVHLWDVTDPANPVELAFFQTGIRGSVHELSARQVGDRLYLYLAVPASERYNEGGDFRIVDATDPRAPVQVSDWGVYSRLNLNDSDLRVLGRPLVYCHSVSVSEDGRYAFLSYWDAGFITLDISDPANPVFLSRTQYEWPDEGNAHSVFPVTDRNLLLAADEDYQIGGLQVELTSPTQMQLATSELPFTPSACTLAPMDAEIVFAGTGCNSAALPDVRGKVAAFDAGGCTYYQKALAAQNAGAAAFLIARTPGATPASGSEPIHIAGAVLSPDDFVRLRNLRQIARVQIAPKPDATWGYLRIFDITDRNSPVQIGRFATENTTRCPAKDGGWYTIHNPVVTGNTAYLSWYSDGVRAVDISDPANPVETGYFVVGEHAHDQSPTSRRLHDGHIEHEGNLGEPESFVWGVVVQDGLIYLSDEKTGLWIVRHIQQ